MSEGIYISTNSIDYCMKWIVMLEDVGDLPRGARVQVDAPSYEALVSAGLAEACDDAEKVREVAAEAPAVMNPYAVVRPQEVASMPRFLKQKRGGGKR